MLLDRTPARKINVGAKDASTAQGNTGTQTARTTAADQRRIGTNLSEMPLEVQTYYYKFRAGLNR